MNDDRIHEILDIPVDMVDLLMNLGIANVKGEISEDLIYTILVNVLNKKGVSQDECNRLTQTAIEGTRAFLDKTESSDPENMLADVITQKGDN